MLPQGKVGGEAVEGPGVFIEYSTMPLEGGRV